MTITLNHDAPAVVLAAIAGGIFGIALAFYAFSVLNCKEAPSEDGDE